MSNQNNMSQHLMQTLNAARAQDEATKEIVVENSGQSYDPDSEEKLPELTLEKKVSRLPDVTPESDVLEDYNQARNVTYACQGLMVDMLGDAAKLAITTENPRAFDVVNNLVTTIRGLNKDLLDFNKAAMDINKDNKPLEEGETKVEVDNDGNVKVQQRANRTSTVEMLRKIEEARKTKEGLDGLSNQDLLDDDLLNDDDLLEAEFDEVKDGKGN